MPWPAGGFEAAKTGSAQAPGTFSVNTVTFCTDEKEKKKADLQLIDEFSDQSKLSYSCLKVVLFHCVHSVHVW